MNFEIPHKISLKNDTSSWKQLFEKESFQKSISSLLSKVTKNNFKVDMEAIINEYPIYNESSKDCRSFLIKDLQILNEKQFIHCFNSYMIELRTKKDVRVLYNKDFIVPTRDLFINNLVSKIKDSQIKCNRGSIIEQNVFPSHFKEDWYSVVISLPDELRMTENTYIAVTTNGFSLEVGIRSFNKKSNKDDVNEYLKPLTESIKSEFAIKDDTNTWWYCVKSYKFDNTTTEELTSKVIKDVDYLKRILLNPDKV